MFVSHPIHYWMAAVVPVEPYSGGKKIVVNKSRTPALVVDMSSAVRSRPTAMAVLCPSVHGCAHIHAMKTDAHLQSYRTIISYSIRFRHRLRVPHFKEVYRHAMNGDSNLNELYVFCDLIFMNG